MYFKHCYLGTYEHNTQCISSTDAHTQNIYTKHTYLSIHICTEALVFECVNTHLVAGWTMASVVHIEAVILTIMAKVNVTVFATP